MNTENTKNSPLIEVVGVKKSFLKSDRKELLVLSDVNLTLYSGEIVALLGKSGSGKSTLLRIIAGLVEPNAGTVSYKQQPVYGPVKGLSMVFQNFALLPWLTVLQNVELGLEALGISRSDRRARALDAIDIIGLDGFESAYPKELSGGMRQRVGFARALVVNPDILLMDEPFSALDVLTADNLRNDLLRLWKDGKTNIKAILIVTHNIEEAALIADRVLIFGSDPGTIRSELKIDIPLPRDEADKKIRKAVDDIYTLMTKPEEVTPGLRFKVIGLGYRLPDVDISEITGLVEELSAPDYKKKVSLQELADELHLDVDNMFSITEALEILHFAIVGEGDIELTRAGRQLAEADILQSKKIFASHLMNYIPLAKHIRRALDEQPNHRIPDERFLSELEEHLSEEAAKDVLEVVIDWGRYAEIFAYDYNTGAFSLENPE